MTQYHWRPAAGHDVPAIVTMAEQHFQKEIDTIFTPEPTTYSRNLTHAIVDQFYSPGKELLAVCYHDDTHDLLAYTWAAGDHRAYWSDDSMVFVKMSHVNLNLSSALKIRLVIDMINLWEKFAHVAGVPIICSNTMRTDQSAFMKLHAKMGYDVRGSFAYKKVDTTKATPAN
jgi:hypothetical protein